MNARVFLCLVTIAGWTQVRAQEKQLPNTMLRADFTDPPTLLWRNGESLAGDLKGVTSKGLLWKTDLFDTPLELHRDVVERIDFPATSYRMPKGTFRVILADGSVISGDIERVGDGLLHFASSEMGSLAIRIAKVSRIERLEGANVSIANAQALLTDKTPTSNGLLPHWMMTAAGGAASPSFNERLISNVPLPDSGVLNFRFRTEREIAFSLKIHPADLPFRIETWEDELVLASGSKFVRAGPLLDPVEREIDLRLCWNTSKGHAELYSRDTKLAELNVKPPKAKKNASSFKAIFNAFKGIIPGQRRSSEIVPPIQLHNKGAGMFIDQFRISGWDHKPMPSIPQERPYIETSQGFLLGTLTKLENGQADIALSDGTETTTPLDTILAFHWPRTTALERDPALTEAWFADGQLLRGTLLDNENLRLQTAFSDAPITTTTTDNLRALILPRPEKPDTNPIALDDMDVLSLDDLSIHGNTEFKGDLLPLFFPVGSASPVLLAKSSDWTLTRRRHEKPQTSEEALVHITSKETLPLQVTGIGRDEVTFTSDTFEKNRLDTSNIHAIQFGGGLAHDVGFAGAGWRSLNRRGSKPLQRDGNAIVLPPNASIGNAHAITGTNISFVMERKSGNSSLRVRLDTRGTNPQKSDIAFLIAQYGRIYCGIESPDTEGQLLNQQEVDVGNEPARIRFRFTESQVQLFINDVPCMKAKRSANRGMGVIIESTNVWGNTVGTTALSDFDSQGAGFTPGTIAFSDEAKREALLLPRLRRDLPPRHLLIGRNGDLLRGEIEAMTRDRLAFRTGLETFQVPNQRLSAIVWLKPPVTGDVATTMKEENEPTTQKQWLDLFKGARLSLEVEGWHPDKVIGRHPLLGRCEIATDRIHRISLKEPSQASAHASLANWQFTNTPDPLLPEDEGTGSPLVGKPAADFTLPTLEAEAFSLSETKGKVVVLDFWATWCGPCVKSLPGLIDTMNTFPQDQVTFLAINQAEGKAQISQFLEARQLQMPVALDVDQSVASKYGVEGIPNTVVIGRDGIVSFVKTGFSADGDEQIAEAVRKALTEDAAAGE